MAIADTIRTALGIAGNVIAFGLFLSPSPTFSTIFKKKRTEEFSVVPYIAALLNCLLWVFYGLPIVHPHSVLVVTINSIGAVFEIGYISIFFIYTTGKERIKLLKMVGAILSFFLVVVIGTFSLAHTVEKRTLFVGSVCVVIGTLMYASPLTIMRVVIRTKSVEYMPFNLILASFLNGLVWTAYALIRFDIFVTIPNGLGSVLAGCQLVIYAIYYKSNDDGKGKRLPINDDGEGKRLPINENLKQCESKGELASCMNGNMAHAV